MLSTYCLCPVESSPTQVLADAYLLVRLAIHSILRSSILLSQSVYESSAPTKVCHGGPQPSVLFQILFILYMLQEATYFCCSASSDLILNISKILKICVSEYIGFFL